MAQQSRNTLKKLFATGAMPAEDAFADLIESMLNIVDHRFDKNPIDGLKVGQIADGRLMSFYHDISHKSAIWSVKMDRDSDGLLFGAEGEAGKPYRAAMALGRAELLRYAPLADEATRQRDPAFELDLQGRLVADGRIGRLAASVPADGEWHDLTADLTGCHAFEVMAGTGRQGSGKYALMHAYAVSTFQGGADEIVYHQAHYGNKCSRLELAWTRNGKVGRDPYRLRIRTRCPLDGAGQPAHARTLIKVYLTQLWFDPEMDECAPRARSGERR
jgi:hypothetical protein